MNRRAAFIILSTFAAATSSCGGPGITEPPAAAPETPGAAITTDSLSYTLARSSGGFYTIVISMVYTNRHAFATQVSDCPAQQPPLLQRWSGTAWELAWQPPPAACTGLATTVAPGAVLRLVEEVTGGLPPSRFIPIWYSVDPSGTHRAVWNVRRAPGSVSESVPIPIEERVSNNFVVRFLGR